MKLINYSVLIIEDHPLIIEAYKSALDLITAENTGISFQIEVANTCDTGYIKIIEASKKKQQHVDFSRHYVTSFKGL